MREIGKVRCADCNGEHTVVANEVGALGSQERCPGRSLLAVGQKATLRQALRNASSALRRATDYLEDDNYGAARSNLAEVSRLSLHANLLLQRK